MEFLGYLGAISFAICPIFQLIKAFKTKSVDDISWPFLITWGFGEVAMTIYIIDNNLKSGIWQYPLLLNYFVNMAILLGIIYARVKYAKKIS